MSRTDENPFATRFTRPGNRFVEPDGIAGVESLSERFLQSGKCGQIVGPHGCGKTCLVYAMTGSLQAAFREMHLIVIRRHGWLGLSSEKMAVLYGSGDNDLLVVDGIESLSPIQRWCLVGSCRYRDCGLLLTTHRVLPGVPVLKKLMPNFAHFEKIVADLAPSSHAMLRSKAVRDAYDRNGGNYREGLMFLYDVFQQQASVNTL